MYLTSTGSRVIGYLREETLINIQEAYHCACVLSLADLMLTYLHSQCNAKVVCSLALTSRITSPICKLLIVRQIRSDYLSMYLAFWHLAGHVYNEISCWADGRARALFPECSNRLCNGIKCHPGKVEGTYAETVVTQLETAFTHVWQAIHTNSLKTTNILEIHKHLSVSIRLAYDRGRPFVNAVAPINFWKMIILDDCRRFHFSQGFLKG